MKTLYIAILLTFLTSPILFGQFTCGDSLTDTRDGQKYATVLVGSDCWFKQNLNYGTYVQSDELTVIHSQQANNGIPEKYAQENTVSNLLVYGGLYEQAELMNYSAAPQGLCPSGWHVSTDAEWQSLITAAGGSLTTATAGTGGNALKATDEGLGQGSGDDVVGVSLRHGGDRDGFGIFYGMGLRAIYWTSTSAGSGQAYHYTLWAENDTIQRLTLGTMTTGFSCRCVKDLSSGTDENSLEGNLLIYPNPANSVINLRVSNFSGQLSVLNPLGQEQKTVDVYKLESDFQFEIANWPSGIYFIQLLNSDKQLIAVEKVIIE